MFLPLAEVVVRNDLFVKWLDGFFHVWGEVSLWNLDVLMVEKWVRVGERTLYCQSQKEENARGSSSGDHRKYITIHPVAVKILKSGQKWALIKWHYQIHQTWWSQYTLNNTWACIQYARWLVILAVSVFYVCCLLLWEEKREWREHFYRIVWQNNVTTRTV